MVFKGCRSLSPSLKITNLYSINASSIFPTAFSRSLPKTPTMANFLPKLWLSGLLVVFWMLGLGEAARGVTTRYWDCCKPSCAWSGKAQVSNPVNTCNIHDQYLHDDDASSACSGGSAYTCSNQGPWAVDDGLAYGFAAVKLAGKGERDWCCACYKYVHTYIHCNDRGFFSAYTSL